MKLYTIVLLLAPLIASGQTMYKCGSTFSQTPCGPDAQAIATQGVIQPSGPADPIKVAAMKASCISFIKTVPRWKDPSSVVVEGPFRGEAKTRTVAGRSALVREYLASANAKNSYGAMQGAKPYVCYANADETAILSLYQPGSGD
jgi:hypothetical protein